MGSALGHKQLHSSATNLPTDGAGGGQTDRQKERETGRMTERCHNVAVTPVAVGPLGQRCVTGTLLVRLVVCVS